MRLTAKIFKNMRRTAKNELNPANNLQSRNGHNFIFIHINKTGGISLGECLELPFKMHFTAEEVIESIGLKKWNQALSFSIVRNPFDKVVSHYFYRVLTNQTGLGSEEIGFQEWVKKCYGPSKDPYLYDQPKMFQPQLDWLRHDGRIAVNMILKFEKLNSDYKKIKELLGLSMDLPHKNKSSRDHYKNYYDHETWEIVADWFKEDIKYFGYDLEF